VTGRRNGEPDKTVTVLTPLLNRTSLQARIVMPATKGRITVSSPESMLSLSFSEGDCAGRASMVLMRKSTIFGRGDDCDVILDGETISRHHCTVNRWGTSYIIQDSSRNGTFVNGQRIEQAQLNDGDQIRIGRNILIVSLATATGTGTLVKRGTTPLETSAPGAEPQIVVRGLEDGVTQPFREATVTIGRLADCQIPLEAENISRVHAAVIRRDDGYYLVDQGSSNGTFLNEQRIESSILKSGDIIRIGNFTLAITLREQDCILTFRKNTK
jgi:pSer/pThr/pTyr-binding forkhead associated (FHA) protein